ncbi:type II CAAX endopeptidase family protein [Lentilactobacillus sp. Marseille-Q4993]|uniref:CPBP family intramembrane glutamic endopeptidase n=1 Tax=Lentilactobacillus sp. Marseille-Q4993 TaxID=3039492 RepID=UPI0024BD2013|nr:type II CAAX endopeptidase family protein [Lentilactobacillus sp. Marseille-Q4993]
MNPQNRKLFAGDYFERIAVMILMIFLVSVVQMPVILIAKGHFRLTVEIALGVGYLIGFALVIMLANYFYHRYANPEKKQFTGNDFKLIILGYAGLIASQMVFGVLHQFIEGRTTTQNNDLIQSLLSSNKIALVLMAFSAVFLSPILEELIFRGILIGGFFNKNQYVLPIIISGLIFSSLHNATFDLISILIYATMGGIFAYLYIRTQDIRVSMGLHFLNNLIAMGLLVVPMVMK